MGAKKVPTRVPRSKILTIVHLLAKRATQLVGRYAGVPGRADLGSNIFRQGVDSSVQASKAVEVRVSEESKYFFIREVRQVVLCELVGSRQPFAAPLRCWASAFFA